MLGYTTSEQAGLEVDMDTGTIVFVVVDVIIWVIIILVTFFMNPELLQDSFTTNLFRVVGFGAVSVLITAMLAVPFECLAPTC